MALRLPLLLLLLLIPTVLSANCKFFSWKCAEDHLMIHASKEEAELRLWSTEITAQYSPAVSQLIVLFRTPPSRDRLDKVKLEFGSACELNPKTYHLVSLNRTESLGNNVTLVTLDKAYLPTVSGFCLTMEVFTYQNGDRVKPRVFSTMTRGCSVNLDGATATSRSSNQSALLPSSLAQLLMHRYSLVAADNCCLKYVGSATGMPPSQPTTLTATTFQTLSSQLVNGLYVLIGVMCLLCLLLLGWLGQKLVVSVKQFKSACKARCRELELQRRLLFARPSVVRLEQLLPADLAGPPYQHLLTHCKSVRTRQRIARTRPSDDGWSNV